MSADLVGFLMASLSLRECHAMAVCKTWKHAWQERPRPKLVHVRDYVTTVPYDDRGAALPGRGLLYPDYDECCLKLFSPAKDEPIKLCDQVVMQPAAIAPCDNTTVWVFENDARVLVKVRLEDSKRIATANTGGRSIAVAGDALLVLQESCDRGTMCVAVLSAETGDFKREFGLCGDAADELHGASSLAVHGHLVYVADQFNQRVQVFRHTDGTHVRSIGRSGQAPPWDTWGRDDDHIHEGARHVHDERTGSLPGEFDEPIGVAIAHGLLFVSEAGGRRIQVLTLEGEPLQVLPSPDGGRLGDITVDREHVWTLEQGDNGHAMHLFELAPGSLLPG